jgi:hypothetical protein
MHASSCAAKALIEQQFKFGIFVYQIPPEHSTRLGFD